jgi:predicted nucleotidyltransferase
MVDQSVVEGVRQYLENLFKEGLDVDFGVIFGSYACGRNDAFSDVDVLVVSPAFDKPIPRQVLSKLWRIAARTDSRIEPVPCGLRRWETDTTNAIIRIAKSSGQKVEAA